MVKRKSVLCFKMIKNLRNTNPDGTLVCYKDNARQWKGNLRGRFFSSAGFFVKYDFSQEKINRIFWWKLKRNTTQPAISPFSGAATGSGGEDSWWRRDGIEVQ